MTDRSPAPDVDALARRLPRRQPDALRSAAVRRALLDAAEATPPPARAAGLRWRVGGAVAAAASLCVWLAIRAGAPPAPAVRGPEVARTGPAAAEPRAAAPAIAPDAPPGPVTAAAGPPPVETLRDGVSRIDTARPMHLARGDTSITAPPGARFEVDVRDDQVRHVTVTSGWVVVAAHAAVTVVVERQSWSLEPPPAPGPSPAASAAPAAPVAPASPVAPAPPRPAPRPPASRPPAAQPGTPGLAIAAAPPPEPAAAIASRAITAERAFHDGLQALLAGRPAGATSSLDRACGVASSSQDDICYWAAIAWLRAGDRGRARRALDEVIARWPGATHAGEASVALGWLLLDLGERSAARARFAAAVSDPLPAVRADAARGLAAAR